MFLCNLTRSSFKSASCFIIHLKFVEITKRMLNLYFWIKFQYKFFHYNQTLYNKSLLIWLDGKKSKVGIPIPLENHIFNSTFISKRMILSIEESQDYHLSPNILNMLEDLSNFCMKAHHDCQIVLFFFHSDCLDKKIEVNHLFHFWSLQVFYSNLINLSRRL